MSITTSIYLDKRRATILGKYPVKIRVTFNRISRLYKTGFEFSVKEFDKIFDPKTRTEELRKTKTDIEQYKINADEIISKLVRFSFDEFANMYLKRIIISQTDAPTKVIEAFELKIKELKEEQRIGTAEGYYYTMISLLKFNNGKNLYFSEVNVNFLKKYGQWQKASGNSDTTIGIYLRNLKALYNEAITNKIVLAENYPFGAKKNGLYEIPTSANNKKALSKAELKKLFDYEPVSTQEEQYRGLWIFSYYCNGLNIKDICLLKYSDIDGNLIEYKREKTKRSSQAQPPIIAAYIEPLRTIVEKFGVPKNQNSYIFPYIELGDQEVEIKRKVSLVVKQINKYIKIITKKLDIQTKITTYNARHSYASMQRNSGVNLSSISQGLGHKNTSTTEAYLDSIPKQEIQINASFLNPNN